MKTASFVAAALLAASSDAAQVSNGTNEQSGNLASSPPFYPSPWMDPQASGWEDAYAKAKAFVSQLTLPEKVNITTGVGWMGEKCVGNVGSVPRMGMKSLCMQDGPLGLRFSDYNSAFPVGLTAGASWARHLWRDRGNAMGSEARDKGVDVLLGPASGPLGRLAKGGRIGEAFGSDPYLQGQAMANTVTGIQGAGVVACAKHYIANEQEHFRQVGEAQGYGYNISETLSSNINDKIMHEYYSWPFQDAVKAGVGSIMCSYQQINNSYGCQNSKMLNGVLKHEYGFQGFVMSDWQAQHSGVSNAVAGMDMSMPGDTIFNAGRSYWGGNLTLAVLNGTVPEYRIDDMAMRIMASLFKVGWTVEGVKDTNFYSWSRKSYDYRHAAAKDRLEQVNFQVDVRANHANHIRESAAKGTVILKNNGVLPLNKPKFLAIVGEDAGPNPKGPNGCPDRGCDDGTNAMLWGSGTSNFPYLITPDSALQQQAIKDGSRYESVLTNYDWTATHDLVSQPNVTAIVFANSQAGEGFINVDGNEGDRNNLTLWKNGDDLIRNVSAICANTIVVIHSGGPVLLSEISKNENVTAIVWAGQPGQESGNSLTDILYGKSSPGRSPFTWGASEESYGNDVLYKPNNGNGAPQDDFVEGAFFDYRHFDKESDGKPGSDPKAPVYEFGFGLSWSTFEYSNLQVVKKNDRPYNPTTGMTIAAPTFGGNFSKNIKDYGFPAGFQQVEQFIYPWLNNTSSGREASGDANYGKTADEFLPPHAIDGSPQPKHPAGGAPGGNRELFDVIYEVTATITNTGKAMTDEIPQLYLSHGGEGEPVRVLRGFDRIERIAPGASVTFRTELTRRDISNWDSQVQNWVVTDAPKTIWVGSSSRNLPLSAKLQ
ncbi:beta-glucosidase 1 precursor [Cordyceps javanica]|uniref:beta-glucosidase n=1 Tax=Cordyceps javanica TaxID=43265 RepID=A0A545VX87_9HYPO|nr:beta-glucosidase 1 precursor [Cordyceps javanica]TQW06330.1 beta-glucosidase 1 precursor [Cordyceps javanica]